MKREQRHHGGRKLVIFRFRQPDTGLQACLRGPAFDLGTTALNAPSGAPNPGTDSEQTGQGTGWINETYTFTATATATATNEILSFLAFGGRSSLALMSGAAALGAAFMVRRTRSSRV